MLRTIGDKAFGRRETPYMRHMRLDASIRTTLLAKVSVVSPGSMSDEPPGSQPATLFW